MSYLDVPRIHFAGRFFSDPSTINNYYTHFDNSAFDRSKHWQPGDSGGDDDGWWNPEGGNRFRLIDVAVTSAIGDDGLPVATGSDSVLLHKLESGGRFSAKLADLDTDQQMVSMIYGLELGLTDAAGTALFEGAFEPAPFSDIWRRGLTGGGDEAASVFYQSVVHISSWGDLSASPVLRAIREKSETDLLSIRFMLDGYSMNSRRPNFAQGRFIGTLGPAMAGEPRHFQAGRQMGYDIHPVGSASPGFRPLSGINYFSTRHDAKRGKLLIDLGNAIPVKPAGGPAADVGPLSIGLLELDGSLRSLGLIDYTRKNWLEQTAGIVELPQGRSFTEEETHALESGRLALAPLSLEEEDYVRADAFVLRLDPGSAAEVRFTATQRGKPLANAEIELKVARGDWMPADFGAALNLPKSVTTNADGLAVLNFTPGDPGNPRFFYSERGKKREHIDGQVYWVGYSLRGSQSANPSNFLSVLVWNSFVTDEPPTWEGSLRPVFEQYGNLYPWMTIKEGIDLAKYDDVVAHKDAILKTLKVSVDHQHYMPAVRDLSGTRRDAMIRWLSSPGDDGLPLRGTAPALDGEEFAVTDVAAVEPLTPEQQKRLAEAAALGSKTAAGVRLQLAAERSENE